MIQETLLELVDIAACKETESHVIDQDLPTISTLSVADVENEQMDGELLQQQYA